MAGAAEILVKYVADTSRLSSAGRDIEQQGGRMQKAAKRVGLAVASGFAVGAVVNFGKSAVTAAQESEVATARLDQIFKSMGDTTGKAAEQAEAYASKLSMQIGVEDEAIMSAQALLATFSKVSDETGRQAGIFDRATAAAADLAAAGFGSMEGNAKSLGRALQNPTKRLTALEKSGVSFTESEKERIKTLEASGKITEAQKILLEAVEKQVGGTAAATATETEKMSVAYGEVSESVGKAMLPLLQKLAPVLVSLGTWMTKHTNVVIALAVAFTVLAASIAVMNVALMFTTSIPIVLLVLGIVAAVVALIAVAILLYKNWDKITAFMGKAMDRVKDAVSKVFKWIKSNWPLLLAILTGPIGIAVLLIVRNWDKIVGAARAAYNTLKSILSKIGGFFGSIGDGARNAAAAVKNALNGVVDFLNGLKDRVLRAAGKVADAIKTPLNAILRTWNGLSFTVPKFTLPSVKIGPKKFGGGTYGGQSFPFPDIPLLATGGIVTRPTLAMIGEAGPEAVVPLDRLGGGSLVAIEQVIVREELDIARLAARLSAALAVRL